MHCGIAVHLPFSCLPTSQRVGRTLDGGVRRCYNRSIDKLL